MKKLGDSRENRESWQVCFNSVKNSMLYMSRVLFTKTILRHKENIVFLKKGRTKETVCNDLAPPLLPTKHNRLIHNLVEDLMGLGEFSG